MRALLVVCLLAGAAHGVPTFCDNADQHDFGTDQSGRIVHLPPRGYGESRTCYIANCQGQDLHVRYEVFLIGKNVESMGVPGNASLSVTDATGTQLDIMRGVGPLSTSVARRVPVTKVYPTGAVLFLESRYVIQRWPGFAASWRCGADPEPLPVPQLPAYVPTACDETQVIPGGTSAYGFLAGLYCFVAEPCGPAHRTGIRINEFNLPNTQVGASLVNSSFRGTTGAITERRIQSRFPREWAASYSGDLGVVLMVRVSSPRDSSTGLVVESRCLPLVASEPTQVYLPSCTPHTYAEGSGEAVESIPNAGVDGKCFVMQCGVGQWVEVSLPRFERGARTNYLQVLQPDTFDSPRVVQQELTTINGSMAGVVVPSRIAAVRLIPGALRPGDAELHMVWRCVAEGTTGAPDTQAPPTPEPVGEAPPTPEPGTSGTAEPGTPVTPAPRGTLVPGTTAAPTVGEDDGDDGLSSGAIVGIVVGSVVAVIVLVAVGVWVWRSSSARPNLGAPQNGQEMGATEPTQTV